LALLLNLDTATEVASICISVSGISKAFRQNEHQKEHGSFVHGAIQELIYEVGCDLADIDAFSVTSGPGSYTGLRVGMSTVKGLCYAFSKPLITVNTLEVMAKAAIDTLVSKNEKPLICPMIDARRMEVFTALYDTDIKSVVQPQCLVLNETVFEDFLTKEKIIFLGSGSFKFKTLMSSPNAHFESIISDARNLAILAESDFNEKCFADVTYSQPNYFKEFYNTSKNQNE